MRFAPTALNAQRLSYIIITDPKRIQYIGEQAMKMLKIAVGILKLRWLLKPLSIFSKGLKRLFIDFSEGSSKEWIIEYSSNKRNPNFFNIYFIVILSFQL